MGHEVYMAFAVAAAVTAAAAAEQIQICSA